MGIDKPDVRFGAHLDLRKASRPIIRRPGGAGRDGKPSSAWMAFGLSDIVQQRRMIEESSGSETFKRVSIGKLEALVGLAETAGCRRSRLLGYFGETFGSAGCGNCDNCLSPPVLRDGKVVAQKLLSCAYRTGQRFGAVAFLIDILIGRMTERVKQFGHERLSVFGIGRDLNEKQCAPPCVNCSDGPFAADSDAFGALKLTETSRGVLKGETEVMLREQAPGSRNRASRSKVAARRPCAPTGRPKRGQ